MLRPVNNHFTKVLNLKTYRLDKRSQKYGGGIFGTIIKLGKQMHVKVKSVSSKQLDPTLVLSFLENFRTSCDINDIHEGTVMQLFQQFMKDPA